MTEEIDRQKAVVLFERAYRHQMNGELGDAIFLYKQSIAIHPTAEAHTFLGWTYSMLQRYDDAIAECQRAIAIDPAFGNPYNDIGAYLIDLEQWEEAIPWLEKATTASRYESPQFPLMNLGRVYQHLGQTDRAKQYFDQALALDPLYLPAYWARQAMLGKLN